MRTAALSVLAVVLGALGLLLAAHWLIWQVDGLEALTARVEAASEALFWSRMAFIGAVIAAWPAAAAWIGRRRQLDAGQVTLLVRARWQLALWLLVFELVIVQGTAARLLYRWFT